MAGDHTINLFTLVLCSLLQTVILIKTLWIHYYDNYIVQLAQNPYNIIITTLLTAYFANA